MITKSHLIRLWFEAVHTHRPDEELIKIEEQMSKMGVTLAEMQAVVGAELITQIMEHRDE